MFNLTKTLALIAFLLWLCVVLGIIYSGTAYQIFIIVHIFVGIFAFCFALFFYFRYANLKLFADAFLNNSKLKKLLISEIILFCISIVTTIALLSGIYHRLFNEFLPIFG